MRLLAVDPGPVESGWCVIDTDTRRPLRFGKTGNDTLRDWMQENFPADGFKIVDHTAIEMVASYGMAVGREVFETCVWIGRFVELVGPSELAYRRDIKLHLCGSARAKDSNIRQALVDRFAPGEPNHGKGTKAAPGWFHGFRADVWAAYALAVYVADQATLEVAS